MRKILATILGIVTAGTLLGGAMALGFALASKTLGMDKYNTKKPRKMKNALNGRNLTEKSLIFKPENKKSLRNRYDVFRIIQECVDEDKTDSVEFEKALKEHNKYVEEYKNAIDGDDNEFVNFLENYVEDTKRTKEKRNRNRKNHKSKFIPIQNPSDLTIDEVMPYYEFVNTPMGQFYDKISLADGIEADKACFRMYGDSDVYPWAILKNSNKHHKEKPYKDVNIYAG